MADTEGEISSSSSSSKPLIVRVKRKSSQSPLEALWLEINERPLKRPLLDFEKLSITTDSSITEIVERKKVLVKHVETVASSKASIQVLQSIVVPNSDDAVDFKTKVEERRQTFKQENKTDKLLLRAREKHEDMAKNARFEQIWKRRKGKGIHEMCNIYDVVRVDEEEEVPKKVEQTEDMSLEDSQILCNFLPLLREYLPEVASEIQSDMYSYINNGEGAAMIDDYVYDLYAVKDEINTAEEEDDLDAYPLVQVGEDDDYYDGPQESEWDTSDSNAEDNPLNEYPDEESSEEETEEEEDEDGEDEDEDEDEDEEGVTRVKGFRELEEYGKTKILHSSEDEYSYEDEDEDEDTLADDEEDEDEDSWKWKHR